MTRPLRGAALQAHLDAEKHRKNVREDYEWLIEAGETHPDRITARLGFGSVETLNRYLYRAGIPIRHYDRSADAMRPVGRAA